MEEGESGREDGSEGALRRFQAWKLSQAACCVSQKAASMPNWRAQRIAVSGVMVRWPCTSSCKRRRDKPNTRAASLWLKPNGAKQVRASSRPGCTGAREGTPFGGRAEAAASQRGRVESGMKIE